MWTKYNPNLNSKVIDPLTVTWPVYADKSIEGLYIEPGEEEYVYGVGYIQHYNVILVKRIMADLVRKYSCPCNTRQEARELMSRLCGDTDAEKHIQDAIATAITAIPPKQEKTPTEANTGSKPPRFRFYD